MKVLIMLLAAVSLQASTTARITEAAALTTITVNVLEIKSTSSKALKAWRAARKATAKIAKKAAGK